jgi:ParB-like chromosome segregation protein Spo0J
MDFPRWMRGMKTVIVGDRKYHLPFADLIPFDAEQDARLGESINEAGMILVPIICWKEKKGSSEDTVIDGVHRVQWASKHGIMKVPVIYRSFDSEDEAKAECERVNADRRHLSKEQQKKHREDRIKRVAELRAQGESERAIAEKTGTSPAQAHEDIKAAVAQGLATEPPSGKITTKDGKKRNAVQICCKRCKRLPSPVRDCQACLADRKAAAKKKNKKEAPKSPTNDDFKNPVPDKLLAAWKDPWIQTTFDFLCVWGEKFRDQKFASGMSKRAKHYPFFNEKDFVDGVHFVSQYLDELCDHIKDFRPAGVCPACSGERCGLCRMSGMVPRSVYKESAK